MNFGAIERQLTDLLDRLQCCPPNSPTSPKSSLSETIKAIEVASQNAFGSSRLNNRICAFCDTARRLSNRRNILIHSELLQTTDGSLVVSHLPARSRQRVIYQITANDIIKLDNDITITNLNLELFMLGVVEARFPESQDNPEMASQLRNAAVLASPPTVVPLKKEVFPQL